jgi:hypothetical protein
MALGPTQPLIEMSTRNLTGRKGRPARGADILTAICELIVYKMWEPRLLTTLWASTACYRDSFNLPLPLLLDLILRCLDSCNFTRSRQERTRQGFGTRITSRDNTLEINFQL